MPQSNTYIVSFSPILHTHREREREMALFSFVALITIFFFHVRLFNFRWLFYRFSDCEYMKIHERFFFEIRLSVCSVFILFCAYALLSDICRHWNENCHINSSISVFRQKIHYHSQNIGFFILIYPNITNFASFSFVQFSIVSS